MKNIVKWHQKFFWGGIFCLMAAVAIGQDYPNSKVDLVFWGLAAFCTLGWLSMIVMIQARLVNRLDNWLDKD